MDCACHGLPAYWTASGRYRAGGFWRCAVRKREYQMVRYDTDPVHRIEKKLHDSARNRRATIDRRRAALVTDREGEGNSSLQTEG
jgi:hypothetical protein